MRLQPNALIQQVVGDAKKALAKVTQDGSLTRDQLAQLPPVLQGVADTFVGVQDTVQADAIVGAIQSGLETTLKTSLERGQLLREELTPGLVGLLSLSSLGVQVERMLAAQQPLSVADAERQAESALRRATPGLKSQLEIYKALDALKQAIDRDDPTDVKKAPVEQVVGERARLMRESVNTAVDAAEQALAQVNTGQAKKNLATTLQAAHDVYSTVSPKSARLRQLSQRADQLGVRLGNDAAQVQPFFARFLENQNRGPRPGDGEAARNTTDADGNTHANTAAVTEKAPSDHEDAGADGDGAPAAVGADGDGAPAFVTEKYPSDAEDGGAGGVGGGAITEKAPSDEEDAGMGDPGGGIGFATEKYPSDAEDGGPGDAPDPDMPVTRKFPSDNEDGGAGGIGGGGGMVTEKAPSDAEDGGAGEPIDPGTMVTLKFPSDAEDGGPGDGGGIGIGTEKYPSDAEDGGPGDGGGGIGGPGDIATEKYPSDAEDGGPGDGGGIGGPGDGGIGDITTEKFPSDAEDGGPGDGGGVDDPGDMVTEKYPSDAEDGGPGDPGDPGINVTLKYPSDHEDGGAGDPGGGDIMVTMKFPSDNEDGGADPTDPGGAVTAKFPSDNEDGGGDVGDGGDAGGVDTTDPVVTAKYPSDAEDGGAGDGGAGGVGNVTTAKFPSDNEDGGAGSE